MLTQTYAQLQSENTELRKKMEHLESQNNYLKLRELV